MLLDLWDVARLRGVFTRVAAAGVEMRTIQSLQLIAS